MNCLWTWFLVHCGYVMGVMGDKPLLFVTLIEATLCSGLQGRVVRGRRGRD